MKHESLVVKNIVIKETSSFRLRLESWEPVSPQDLYSVNFIQECLDSKGNVETASTYNFIMSREEIKILCEGLLSL